MTLHASARSGTSLWAVATLGVLAVASSGCSGEPSSALAKPAEGGIRYIAPEGNGVHGRYSHVQDAFLQWPLPAGAEGYADIDGRRALQYVVEQAEISRRYRDQGHPKYWGRIIGSSADAESAEWLATKFKDLGMSDVRIQPFDLQPTWVPKQDYEVRVSVAGDNVELTSAQPFYRSPGTPAGGLDLEAVYVGLGSEADYLGKNVAGKAVFIYTNTGLPYDPNARVRAEKGGAAAVFESWMLPGNMRFQAYPGGERSANPATLPTFSLGGDDGFAVRDLIASASGRPVRVKVRLDVEMVSGLETALVWGTLPGASDETIYMIAHRDGWFDAGSDNGAGVASMLELAAHYAKLPQSERPRTMVFIGTDGHHNSGAGSGVGLNWLDEHHAELFGKTALMINNEHPAAVQTNVRARYMNEEADNIFWANTYAAQQWYAGGPQRPELEQIALDAFREFGVTIYAQPNARPPAGELSRYSRYVPGVATSEFLTYFQNDMETPETVPWTGLEAMTRAYARIIDRVNDLPLSALQRPEETTP